MKLHEHVAYELFKGILAIVCGLMLAAFLIGAAVGAAGWTF